MILDMQSSYIEYLAQVNKTNKKHNKICTYILRLEQEFYISNKKRKQAVSFLQQQTIKVKHYEKMIVTLQNLAFAKLNKLLPFIKRLIDQHDPAFIYTLSALVNRQLLSKIQYTICNTHIRNDDGSFGSGRLIKALSNLPIFINRKNQSINQQLSKMQKKFEIN